MGALETHSADDPHIYVCAFVHSLLLSFLGEISELVTDCIVHFL